MIIRITNAYENMVKDWHELDTFPVGIKSGLKYIDGGADITWDGSKVRLFIV